MNLIITGANRGLGLMLVLEAAKRGHTVWAGVRKVSESGSLKDMARQYPGKIEIVPLDVTNEEGISSLAERLHKEGRSIDSIINNAAVLIGREHSLEELQIADLERTMDVNVYGPIRMVKHFMRLLPSHGSSTIVNVSSASGSFERAYGGDYSYAISKAALNLFSQQLHHLLEPKGSRVYAVHPGWLRTDMGGPQATNDPSMPAPGIIDLAEGKIECERANVFVDHNGKTLPR
ncbi:SDR family oxidoreductase [Cohnella cholangitidis]|uniref:SDR family oxidoreductase n=1 Tax=Cohnella cholangitidis TaxID=2598458 RepID=A0A7G5C0X8_9BACL|nr:SDR family oxidoreductase [Cohnella cholangitidis]QMV42862.1 SDR family oxidoreductase [Cohnella cholangitidis]